MSTGKILAAARADFKRFIEGGGFDEDIVLKTPDGATSYEVKGSASKHHINFDSDGNPINSKNAHICIVESSLIDLGIQTRNASGEVNLLKWRVDYPDSTGQIRNYIIDQTFPDETVGGVVCILGDFQN